MKFLGFYLVITAVASVVGKYTPERTEYIVLAFIVGVFLLVSKFSASTKR